MGAWSPPASPTDVRKGASKASRTGPSRSSVCNPNTYPGMRYRWSKAPFDASGRCSRRLAVVVTWVTERTSGGQAEAAPSGATGLELRIGVCRYYGLSVQLQGPDVGAMQ